MNDLPRNSTPGLNRSWKRNRNGFAAILALLIVIGVVVMPLRSVAQGNSTSTPMVTANGQWKPVVRTFEGVDMVLVPTGCFMMGSTQEQIDGLNKRHPVGQSVYSSSSKNFFNAEGLQNRVCF